jgi:serpin B
MRSRIAAVLVAAMALAACGGGGGGGTGVETGELKSDLARNTNPIVAASDGAALADGNRAFALELYRVLASKQKGEDVFLSPHSISIALAMCYGGARNNTATEMAAALHFDLPQDKLHGAFNALDLELDKRSTTAVEKGDPFQLSVANATWGQVDHPFLKEYLDLLAVNYGAGLRVLDFATDPEACRKEINAWVSDETKARIPELLDEGTLNDMVKLVLTNAVYFKASWAEAFEPDFTKDAPFTRLDGTPATVPMMTRSGTLPYAESEADGWQAVALPYAGNQVSMVVIVPKAGTFDAFEAGLDGAGMKEILGALKERDGTVSLPKFGVESSFSLADALKELGMVEAFSTAADFSGMDGLFDLMVSDVIHKSFVAVDEKGTEAAAATAVIMVGKGMPDSPFVLAADRPFLFAIVDQPTDAILFLGRVVAPK